MSTRSTIARVTGEGTFLGVYHHWDGYPSGLGKTLYTLYNTFFQRGLRIMLRTLIDEHPAGWSTIQGADFNLPAGFREDITARASDAPHGPECFCHGDRHEEAQPITQDDDAGMEWAYVFDVDKRIMHVLERVYNTSGEHMVGMFGVGAEGNQRWAIAGDVVLDDLEPNWDNMTADNYRMPKVS